MKYVCSVCGYIYDEAAEGVPFASLPDSWVCPLCGAPKALFNPAGGEEKKEEVPAPAVTAPAMAEDEDLEKLTAGQLAGLFSNLARGCEKQYQEEAKELFEEISRYFDALTPEEPDADMQHLAALVKHDLDEEYRVLRSLAEQEGDRGTLRICTWGEKVTMIVRSLLDRVNRDGIGFLERTEIWVCTVCGFVYVGENPPELCPVCKVPSWKFRRIERRA